MARCRSCGAALVWALTEKNAKRIPLDADPDSGAALRVPDGNLHIVATKEGIPVVRVRGEEMALSGPHRSHFASCPNASDHRKGKAGSR